METLGLGKVWEELPVGYQFRTVGRTLTASDLSAFIQLSGMVEVLFTDATYAAEHAPQGRQLLPGALVYSAAEGLVLQATLQGTGLAFLNMEFNVNGPTFVGDTIHVEAEVIECRPTSKDPSRGLVRTRNKIVNQDGVTVITYSPLRMTMGRETLVEHWDL